MFDIPGLRHLKVAALSASLATATTALAELPEDTVWIDVRTVEEWNEGHLDGAHRIDYDTIIPGVSALGIDKNTPVYLYCKVGGRAERARQELLAHGYSNVVNVKSLAEARETSAELANCTKSSDAPDCNKP